MKYAIILATATSAEAAKVSGGMSLISPEIITALFVGLSSLVGSISLIVWGNKKAERKIEEAVQRFKLENDPINVREEEKPVTQTECKNYRCALERRIDALGPALERVFLKLDENDKRSEERTKGTHRRLDPLIAKVAANAAEVDLMKKIVIKEKTGDEK